MVKITTFLAIDKQNMRRFENFFPNRRMRLTSCFMQF